LRINSLQEGGNDKGLSQDSIEEKLKDELEEEPLDFLLEISYVLFFGRWAFFYKLVYDFMFLGLGLLVRFSSFLKLICLYIEVSKTNVNTFSHILNLISLKREFSLLLA